MKRLIAFLLSCVFLTLVLLPSVSAAETEESEAEKFRDSAVFSCVYNETDKQIVIEGTVNHDVMLNHRDYTIKVYSFSADSTYEELLANDERVALASANLTIKFTFHIKTLTISERFAKYVLVFCSPEGEEYLVGEPLLPSVASDFEYIHGDRSAYKGIFVDEAAYVGESGAGTVIIDVMLDEAFADNSNSIIYPINDTSVYFGRSFVTNVDKKVIEAWASGARIYLRFLTRASNAHLSAAYLTDDERLSLPDLYSEQTLNMIYAVSSFFSQRYDGTNGRISGVILGSKIDDVVHTNHIGSMSLDEYAELYSLYLVVVANAMRTVETGIDVVIPLSDANDYGEEQANKDWGADELLGAIVSILNNSVSGDFDCSVMIQSSYVPFGISNSNIKDGIDMSAIDNSKISASNIGIFTAYVDDLSRRYSSAPTNIIYNWEQPADLRGNALCCAYAYTFYKLYGTANVSAFVISVDKASIDAYKSVADLVRYIDTVGSTIYTERFLKYFGKSDWSQIVGNSVKINSAYSLIETEMTSNKKFDYVGKFTYIDFSNSSVINYMHKGNNAEDMIYAYDGIETRTLKIGSSALEIGDSFGCVGIYEYSEKYAYTPTMSLRLRVDGGVEGALYEVTLTFGTGKDRIISKGVVGDNELTTLYFDAYSYSSAFMADNIRISVRCLTDSTEKCVLWLYDLSGYSDIYNSDELSSLIDEQRRKIRDPNGDENEGWNSRLVLTVVGVILAIIAVGIGLLMVFRKDDSKKKE